MEGGATEAGLDRGRRVRPLDVACPTCGAWPGVPCSKCKRRDCPCGGNEFHAARARAALAGQEKP